MRAEGMSRGAGEPFPGYCSEKKRAKLLRTENRKLADVYWLLFFLILPDSFLALKVQTLHQRA